MQPKQITGHLFNPKTGLSTPPVWLEVIDETVESEDGRTRSRRVVDGGMLGDIEMHGNWEEIDPENVYSFTGVLQATKNFRLKVVANGVRVAFVIGDYSNPILKIVSAESVVFEPTS